MKKMERPKITEPKVLLYVESLEKEIEFFHGNIYSHVYLTIKKEILSLANDIEKLSTKLEYTTVFDSSDPDKPAEKILDTKKFESAFALKISFIEKLKKMGESMEFYEAKVISLGSATDNEKQVVVNVAEARIKRKTNG